MPADIAIRSFEVTHRGVLAIAVPMTLAYLSTPIVGVVNLGAVGQVGDPAMVGGVAIGALLFNFISWFMGLLIVWTMYMWRCAKLLQRWSGDPLYPTRLDAGPQVGHNMALAVI